VLEPSSRIAC